MWRMIAVAGIVLAAGGSAPAAEVWKSTFDTDADGVVDVYDNNPAKTMIGSASGGKLEIHSQDSASFAETDRSGRPLGVAVDGHGEFSALYTFMWSGLNPSEAEVWEFAGFTASPPSNPGIARAWTGALLRHRNVGGDYRVRMGVQWGTTYGQDRYAAGTDINLGPDPFSQTYQLAISYLGGADDIFVLDAELFDSSGTSLGIASATSIDGLLPWGSDPAAKAAALDALLPTHLGWGDYKATAVDPNRDIIWQVDSLGFYDTVDGALNAVVPEPASALLLVGGCLVGLGRRVRRRT